MQGQLDVLPGVGIGTIRFGMRCDEVLALIDEPSCHEEWMGGNLCDALLYHGLRLHFSEYNSDGPLPVGRIIYLWSRRRCSIWPSIVQLAQVGNC